MVPSTGLAHGPGSYILVYVNKVHKALPSLFTGLLGRYLLDLGSFWKDRGLPGMVQAWGRAGRDLDPCRRWGFALLGSKIANEIYSKLQIEYVVSLPIM